jgi:hypothetical protein
MAATIDLVVAVSVFPAGGLSTGAGGVRTRANVQKDLSGSGSDRSQDRRTRNGPRGVEGRGDPLGEGGKTKRLSMTKCVS